MKKVPFFTVEERSDRPRDANRALVRRVVVSPTTFAPLLFVEIIVIAMHEVIWWPC